MSTTITQHKLVWKEIIRGRKWATSETDRFYKIIYFPRKEDGRATSDGEHYSLYLSYPQGMDHYIKSARTLDYLKNEAEQHLANRK